MQQPSPNLQALLNSLYKEEDYMPYHSLSECTLTAAERLEEAGRIVNMIESQASAYDKLTAKEQNFIESLKSSCSVKQLFWLRDIKDRVI
jgi:hypothetical protein